MPFAHYKSFVDKHVGFMVDEMALEQVFIQVLWSYTFIDHSTTAPYLYFF